MTPVIAAQTDFSAGEISEKLAGRFQSDIYSRGCSLLENMIPLPTGGITKRPGTWLMGSTKSNGQARLLPFVINDSLAYILEFGNGYIRAWTDTGSGLTYTGTEITTTYATADLFEIQFVQIYRYLYLVHRNYAPSVLQWTSGNNFNFSAIGISTNTTDINGDAVDPPFNGASDYPGCVAVFNGRMVFASSINEPQTIWMTIPFPKYGTNSTTDAMEFTYYDTVTYTVTQLKDPDTWADAGTPETEEITTERNVVGVANAMKFTIASDRNDRIQWLSSQKDLVVGTSAGEWVIPSSITAQGIQAIQHTRIGSVGLQGTVFDDAVVFVQRGAGKLREFKYNEVVASYQSPDLCFHADHILTEGVVQLDFASIPDPYLYMVRADGALCVLAYNKQYGVQGWGRWTIGDHDIESVAVIPGDDGIDEVYIVVERYGGKRYVEKFDALFQETFLDSMSTEAGGTTTITGLDRMNGMDVIAMYDSTRNVHERTVYSSTITVPVLAGTWTVGIPFTAKGRSMRLNTPSQTGTGQGQKKRIVNTTFRVYDSADFSVGPDASHLDTVDLDNETKDITIPFPGDYDTDGYIYWEQESVDDLTILAMMPEVAVR